MTPSFVIISAIICLLILFLIVRNLYKPIYVGYSAKIEEYDKLKFPLFFYIFAIIICIIPIANILGTVILIGWCTCKCCDDKWIVKGPIGKIYKFLSKPL